MRLQPRRSFIAAAAVALSLAPAVTGAQDNSAKTQKAAAPAKPGKGAIRIVTLDPGHFHAALPHRESYPGVDTRVHVYAPLGSDLIKHLGRILQFNTRAEAPTAWALDVHTGPDYLDRFKREKAGNVVVISGRNRGKIDYIQTGVGAGYHALVDKPWILRSEDLPKLKATLDLAEKKGRVAFDMMTERFEITTLLQKELVNDPEVFGKVDPGTPDKPSVYMESVHHLMKVVAGAPNIRPAWFFDKDQQGEGMNDIGTHLVDLVPWTLWPEQGIDREGDPDPVGPALADHDQQGQLPAGDGREGLPGISQEGLEGRRAGVLLQLAGHLHRARRAHEAEHHLGLGSAGGHR